MKRVFSFVTLFKRERRPGDIVFAALFFCGALTLLYHLPTQTKWIPGTLLTSQPAFWPIVSIACLCIFSGFHLLSSAASPRIPGRLHEIWFWCKSAEYAIWFMIYVQLVPIIGYLLATLIFTEILTFRLGYRSAKSFLVAAAFGIATVLIFKTFLQVKVPGGMIYEWLPNTLRSFFITYL